MACLLNFKVPLNLLGSLAPLKDQSLSTFTQSFFFDFAKGVRCLGGFYDTHSWSTAGFYRVLGTSRL